MEIGTLRVLSRILGREVTEKDVAQMRRDMMDEDRGLPDRAAFVAGWSPRMIQANLAAAAECYDLLPATHQRTIRRALAVQTTIARREQAKRRLTMYSDDPNVSAWRDDDDGPRVHRLSR